MANQPILPAALLAQLNQARAVIPPAHREKPREGSIIPDIAAAYIHINDWAFLNGHGYVNISGSEGREARYRYACLFHSRKQGEDTRDYRQISEKDRQRVNTHTQGMSCPVVITIRKLKFHSYQWVLTHNSKIHNHPPAANPFDLDPHIHRKPGRAMAIAIARTHRGVLPFSLSKEILKDSGLGLTSKEYYNLRDKESTYTLNAYQEADLLLKELEARDVHVAVKDQYVLDKAGNRTDRVIQCIAWWTPEQIRMARRFVSDMLAETDATFNTNQKRLLLQCFVGIDNTGATFQFLQAFSTAESADIIRFLLQILEDHFFYDCPGFAVLAGDFGAGLNAGFVQKAAQDARNAEAARNAKEKQVMRETSPDKLQLDHHLLSIAPRNRPAYELDSQTILVNSNPIRAIPPTVIGVNFTEVILQFCTWHGAEAIKKKLITKGYPKARQDELNELIWQWIKAPDFDALEIARNKLILALNNDEKEYLIGWYQPKEPQFCHAYTCQYRNLGVHATGRVEGNHNKITTNLYKNLKVSESVRRLCNRLDSLAIDHFENVKPSRIGDPRLFDRIFFSLVRRQITLYALEMCSSELLKAKYLYDTTEEEDDIFKPEVGCKELCELPLRYRLPCKHWMLYFYRKDKPIPINLFHPRWLIDGPSTLYESWHIRLDNHDYSTDEPIQERYVGDRSAKAGEQLILDTSRAVVHTHQKLPPIEKEVFARAFKKICDSLISRQDEKLDQLQQLPRRLPDAIIQPKLTFGKGRKRALTGAESAAIQEKDEALQRSRARKQGMKQAQNDARQEEDAAERSQVQVEVARQYSQQIEHPQLKRAVELWENLQPKPATNTPLATPSLSRIDDNDPFGSDPDSPSNPSLYSYKYSSQPKRQIEDHEHIVISDNEPESDDNRDDTSEHLLTERISKSEEPRIDTTESTKSNDSSDDSSLSDFPDINNIHSQYLLQQQQLAPASTAPPSIGRPLQRLPPVLLPSTAPSASRPTRERKITTKQASQNRRNIEKQQKKNAKLAKKPKTVDTSQFDVELPFRSSQ